MEAVELWQFSRSTFKPEILFIVAEPTFWAKGCAINQLSSLHGFHSFIPRVQSALCCGGGKLSWVWLWCLLWHSFPKWPHSTHSSALISQGLLVRSTAFYNLPAFKWQLNEEEPCLGAACSMTSLLRRAFSTTAITRILHNHPRQKFSFFPCPCKQHTEMGSQGKHMTFSTPPWKKQKVAM